MSYGLGVTNIYELLDDENDEQKEQKVIQQKESKKKEAKPAAKSSTVAASAKPQTETRKSDRPTNENKGRKDIKNDRSADKGDRKPKEASKDIAKEPPKGELQEGSADKSTQRRNRDRVDRHTDRAEGRIYQRGTKRVYDRRSGTGRGRENKKGGSGKGNWGSIGDEGQNPEEFQKSADSQEVKDVETQESTENQNQTESEKHKEKEETEEQEEGPKERTLDEYLKERKAPQVELPQARKAGEGVDQSEWANLVELRKDTAEEQSIKVKEKKHKDQKKKSTLPVNEVLKIDTPKRQRPQRDTPNQRRRGNAGKGFPAKRGGSKQDINLLNEVNFPALSTKA